MTTSTERCSGLGTGLAAGLVALRLAAALLVLCAGWGCVPVADSPAAESVEARVNERWDSLVSEFLDAYFEQSPASAVRAGRHEFDGQVPDLSAAGTAVTITVYKDYQAQAEQFSAVALSRDRQFERELMIWYLGRRLFWLETARRPATNPMYHRSAVSPTPYLTREYAPLSVRMRALTQLLERTPVALEQIAAKLDEQLAASLLKRSIGFYSGLARHIRSATAAVFARTGTEGQRLRLQRATEAAAQALDSFAALLKARMNVAGDAFALGPELYSHMLRATEMVHEPLAQLKARGEADLARNLTRLQQVCAEQLKTPDLTACMGLADQQKSLDPVARGGAQLGALKQFVLEHDLLTIPSDELALVQQSPPHNRANLAYISIPGPFEPEPLPSVYYISPPDPSWSKAVQRGFVPNEGRLLYISVHEAWPGHFLWGLRRNRANRPLVRLFRSTTFSEGWAHYAEEMMHEAGLSAGDPLLHIGQLANALKRNVRYLSAIGLHTEGMTLAESETMFLAQGQLDLGNARQQAARGAYDPGYLAYTLGKLQILELREAWLAEDARRTLKQFHDALLSYGGAPIALVRKYMLIDN